MKKTKMKTAKMGLIFSVLAVSLAATPAGHGTASAAAASKSMAAVYAQVQAERAAQVVALVNKERTSAGLKPLIVHTNLSKMAKDKAVDMFRSGYFDHTVITSYSIHYTKLYERQNASAS